MLSRRVIAAGLTVLSVLALVCFAAVVDHLKAGTGFNVGGAVVTLSGSSVPQRILSIFSDVSGMTGTIDGVLRNGNTSSAYQVSGVPFWIGGGGPGQSAAGDWIGTVAEANVFNVTLTTSQRQTLERNQGAYFGITVP
jgi:hypothetical protein